MLQQISHLVSCMKGFTKNELKNKFSPYEHVWIGSAQPTLKYVGT